MVARKKKGERGYASQCIRDVFEDVGLDAGPKQVIELCKKRFKLETYTGQVSQVKDTLKKAAASGEESKPRKRKTKSKASAPVLSPDDLTKIGQLVSSAGSIDAVRQIIAVSAFRIGYL